MQGVSFFQRARDGLGTGVQAAVKLGLRVTRDPVGLLLDQRRLAADPYPIYERIRRRGPLARTRVGGLHVATGHDANLQAVRRLRVGVPIADQGAYHWDSPLSPSLLDLNPPDHTRVRRLVAQAFTPKAIARLRERAQEVADRLLDAAATQDGPVDLIADYAAPLPVTLICEMLGVPADDHERFRRWGDVVALSLEMVDAGQQEAIDRAAGELDAYFGQHFERRRHESADDVLSALVAARDGGDRLSQKELVATCILLLIAGFETTINLIGNGTLALLDAPDQRDAFTSDPRTLGPNAIEELLRYDSPVQLTSRHAEEDTEVAGREVRKGEHILCLLGAGNRDPEVFTRPQRLDLTRANAKDHLSFSSGAHHCLGASLARLEGEIALASLFERFPDLRLAGTPRRRTTIVLRGLETLPIALGRQRVAA